MGIVEQTLRKMVRVGQSLDVTLIGGKELRGKVTAFAEDGLLLMENGYERPIAFAGVATYLPTELVQADFEDKLPVQEIKEPEKIAEPEPEEIVKQEEGWIERYDATAGVGSIACKDEHAVFHVADVLDQQLADQLAGWFGRPIAVQCCLHIKGALVTATGITERRTLEKFVKNDKVEKTEIPAERYGFGEILHFDKQEGFGKACEGDVKFLFKRADIVSDVLWQEIISSSNTCGIKIAFTAVQEDGRVKYTRLREIAALHTPDDLEKPDFNSVIPREEAEDVNPYARTTFTDGTVMGEETYSGFVMFYNAEKNFGRVQRAEDSEKFYFRANDVMQKTLLDHLNNTPVVADTQVTFSVKKLPTGKEAAGRLTWEAPRPTARKAMPAPVAAVPAKVTENSAKPAAAPQTKKNEVQKLNLYCENMCKLWEVAPDALSDKLVAAAESCEAAAEDLLLENVALSDVRREKRDDAMLRCLRLTAQGGGEQLSSFLSTASYDGKEMFDALTRLFAVSDGAYGRLCGIIASGGELVTLRGEILQRFGQVPETAAALKELWKPLVEEQRAATAYGAMLHGKDALLVIDPEKKHADWEAAVELYENVTVGQAVSGAEAVQTTRALRETVKREPTRAAVEWLLPMLDKIEEGIKQQGDAQGLAMRPLCAMKCAGERVVCVEITGSAKGAVVTVQERALELGEIAGSVQAVVACEEEKAVVKLTWDGGSLEQEMEFAAAEDALFDEEKALAMLQDTGVCMLRGGAMAQLELLAQSLNADEKCAVICVDKAQEEAELLGKLLLKLQEGLEAKFGAQNVGLIGFPAKTEGMSAEALREALVGVMRDFGDMRLLHDALKGAHIALLVEAGEHSEKMAVLAAEMMENGVRTVIAANKDVQAENTVEVCEDTAADRLRAAGFTAQDVRMA